MYQDEHACIHVVNVHYTYKHNIAYNVTYKIGGKVGRELSSIVEQLGGYTVCLKVSIAKLSKLMEQKTTANWWQLFTLEENACTEYGVE